MKHVFPCLSYAHVSFFREQLLCKEKKYYWKHSWQVHSWQNEGNYVIHRLMVVFLLLLKYFCWQRNINIMCSYRAVAVLSVIQLSSSNPADAASSTRGNSLFTKALPLCAFGVVTLRFDFLLFKEVCYCHQGLYLITERHQREMKHSCDSLECASWRKPAPSP